MITKRLIVIIALLNIQIFHAQVLDEIKYDDFSLGNFSTLSRLKNELKDVRIVGLGESNHSMGTTFEAKVAMIKYLHDSLGFNVIAFESGIYDCSITNQLLKKGECKLDDFYNSLFSIWKCKELENLFTYLKSSNETDKPIEFIGIDNQFLGHATNKLMNDYKILEDSLRLYNKDFVLSDSFYKILQDEIKYSNYFKKFSIADTTIFSKNLAKVNTLIDESNLSNVSYYSFWKKVNSNLRTDFIRRFYPSRSLRDSMMAINLIDYMELNPNAKVIVWSASYHLMYNTNNISSDNYKKKEVAGEKLKKQYKSEYYFIAFTAFGGRFGAEKGLFSFKLKQSKKGSIEFYINANLSTDFGFFSLREKENIDKISSETIKTARILGAKEEEMKISEICDGIFFIKDMEGVNYYKK